MIYTFCWYWTLSESFVLPLNVIQFQLKCFSPKEWEIIDSCDKETELKLNTTKPIPIKSDASKGIWVFHMFQCFNRKLKILILINFVVTVNMWGETQNNADGFNIKRKKKNPRKKRKSLAR